MIKYLEFGSGLYTKHNGDRFVRIHIINKLNDLCETENTSNPSIFSVFWGVEMGGQAMMIILYIVLFLTINWDEQVEKVSMDPS